MQWKIRYLPSSLMEYLLQTQAGNFCGLWWVKLRCMNRIVNTGEGLFRTGSHSCTNSNQAGIWTDLLFVFVLSRRKYYIFDYIEFKLIRIQLHVALERNESFLRDCAKRSKSLIIIPECFSTQVRSAFENSLRHTWRGIKFWIPNKSWEFSTQTSSSWQ